jgi:hypothetical protein
MKKILATALLITSFLAGQAQQGTAYGEPFKEKKVISVPEFKGKLETKESWNGVVTGKVKEVCKREGCWLRLDDGSATGIMVKMKDHAFVLPKDIDGKTVVIAGTATKKTTSVEQLKHYAEDAGKTKEEIDAITAPKMEISMDATGVIVK